MSLVRRSLAGNFPLIVAGCASLATLTARQKTCASFPRLSAAVACDFDNAVFFEVTVAIIIAGNSNFKIHPAPLKSRVRARLFFGNSARTV